MKPSKNRVFCIGCKRTKMLFESDKKADNFIKFNKETIEDENGKAPVRSYYCVFCAGWHVTSNPSSEQGENMDYRDMSVINKMTNDKKECSLLMQSIAAKAFKIKQHIILSKLEPAEELLQSILLDFQKIKELSVPMERLVKVQRVIYEVDHIVESAMKIRQMNDVEIKTYLSDFHFPIHEKDCLKVYAYCKLLNLSLNKAITLLKKRNWRKPILSNKIC